MVQLGPTALKSEMKFQICVVEGRRPVMKEFLLGLHTCIPNLVSVHKPQAPIETAGKTASHRLVTVSCIEHQRVLRLRTIATAVKNGDHRPHSTPSAK